MAAQMVDIQPLKRALGGNIYLELTEWNGSKRVDLRFWKDGTVPTKESSLCRTVGPFIDGNKVLSGENERRRCLDRHEHVVSDMVSPLYWFLFYDSDKQIVYDVRHVAQGFPLIQI
jgi:hypothetical protein